MNEAEQVHQGSADSAPAATSTTPKSRLRWLRLTPERLVIGLLLLEVLLWLSERFRWFGFNQHKGCTVLIGVTCFLAFLVLVFFWFIGALLLRWRFQFSIRTLLLLTIVVPIPCSWLASEMRAARRQEEAVEAIRRSGGIVMYDWETKARQPGNPLQPPRSAWLRTLLGDAFFAMVTEVYLEKADTTDGDLERLKGLTHLQVLFLDGMKVSDVGLEHLKALTQLRHLRLENGTKVGDAGLEHLKGLTFKFCSSTVRK
jgi:hypothetical protein